MSVNKARAALLRDAAESTTNPARREQLVATAARLAALPDSAPHPSDRPLFDLHPDAR